ncbi:MAG: cysteine desulfurase [Ignavibacteriaceae bacterium]|nr:cysteine desulfurase [Ignavibacteriaceae bacterium]
MINAENLKSQFPIFRNIPGLVFLDNASTTQKPQIVLDKLLDVYTKYNSNVHRGLYPIAVRADEEYDLARKRIARLINADKDEIVFTSGTTDSTNLIAASLLASGIIPEGANILTSEIEHHSNFLPWQNLTNGNLSFAKYENGNLNYPTEQAFDVVVFTIMSNVTGKYIDIEELRKGELKNAIFIADAAQAIAHVPIDVKKMDVDFLVFSGHKMFGPTGVGIVYGKKELLNKMQPFKLGGGMINKVSKENFTSTTGPQKFEAGTPPIADAIALGEAVNFIEGIGFENIIPHEQNLRRYALNKLSQIKKIKIYHDDNDNSGAVISFTIYGIHPHDIAQYLGDNNICVRAGHHCTQILHKDVLQIPASVRVSMSIYNNENDIDNLIEELNNCIAYYS